MADVTMPQLGETVTEGTITRWFKAVGDKVDADETLFEVSTDKVDSEVPSSAAGYLTEILVHGNRASASSYTSTTPRARARRPTLRYRFKSSATTSPSSPSRSSKS